MCDIKSYIANIRIAICLLVLLSLSFTGCNAQKKIEPHQFSLPAIPTTLINPKERADYLALHYWDNFDFADTAFIHLPDITEQAFVDYLQVLPYSETSIVNKSISTLLNISFDGGATMFNYFADLFEKYLYDPNSPMRNEELYIPVLQAVIASEKVESLDKVRPQYRLDMAMKNRVGNIAADFEFTSIKGVKGNLSKVQSDYIILFFNNPDCEDCKRVKDLLSNVKLPSTKVVATYSEDEVELWQNTKYPTEWINGYAPTLRREQLYDLKAMPTLYLLDKDKKVIFKDATVEVIITYLTNNAKQ